MKKTTFFLLSLLTVFVFTACSDGLDNIEYNRNSDVVLTTPEATATGTSLNVKSSITGNLSSVVKRGFCYSVNVSNPTIKDKVIEADENFSATLSGLKINTPYYIRAYVYGNSRYTYSETFTSTIEITDLNEQLKNYVAPEYEDNYAGIASWSNRTQWNLANVHDPSVVLAEDGYYYMYQTDASYGNAHTGHGHFHARRSKDLVNWEYLGGTMPKLPDWVMPKLNEIRKAMGLTASTAAESDFGYWAPNVQKVRNGLYRMYYSIVVPGYLDGGTGATAWSERAFIGLMENSNPANNSDWVDKGYVVTNASDKGLNFNIPSTQYANCYYKWNAIDPSYIITPENTHWLIYGSWHSGIVAMELNAETGMPKQDLGIPWAEGNAPAEYGQLIATRNINNRWQASEGPEIIYNTETGYYYLFVAYDALDIPYNTRVCRSNGWPLVMPERYGAVPQVAITEEELIGNWEHIDLSYAYGVQKESAIMTLAVDHTITEGTWKGGRWSYDAEQQILTANGTDLYLQREVDWEASPRTPTIVYAAYGSNHKTYWGKKVK